MRTHSGGFAARFPLAMRASAETPQLPHDYWLVIAMTIYRTHAPLICYHSRTLYLPACAHLCPLIKPIHVRPFPA